MFSESGAAAAPERAGVLTRLGPRFAALVGKPAFWALAVALLFLVPIGRSLARGTPEPPSLRLPLPAFELTDQTGKPFGSADLRGKIWVADFVFTTCPTACPRLTQRMLRVQRRCKNMGDALHLVTFTVDPENDTPERLAEFARAYKADTRRWTFVTGSLEQIEKTVVSGFKMAMGKEESSEGSGIFSIFHGERLVLVDAEGNIRGYYEADDDGIESLLYDIKLVAHLP
jgi:protein SCO1/2